MKKFLLIVWAFFVSGSFTAVSSAQERAIEQMTPIKEIKEAFTSPPDMLDATLKKVQSLEPKSASTKKVSEEEAAAELELAPFKNPFIPKTPQAQKEVFFDRTNTWPPTPVTTEQTVPIPQFTLSGLVWNTKKPAAILNGKIVAIGDEVSSWSISKITKEGVLVTYEDQTLWVKPVVDMNFPAPNQRNNR